MLGLKKKIWVLTADDSKARVLETLGPGARMEEIPDGTFSTEKRSGRELYSDRPGRGHESHSPMRHAMDYKTPADEQERRRFVQDLSDWLVQAHQKKRFDRLVLVAAPKTLGALRKQLPQNVQDFVSGSLAKDLTGAEANDIAKTLRDQGML